MVIGPQLAHTMQRKNSDIHILGDAAAQGDMPKSGFSANSQAKVCSMAVRGELTDSKVFPAKFSNTCWSLVDTNDGIKVGASYEATTRKLLKSQVLFPKQEKMHLLESNL